MPALPCAGAGSRRRLPRNLHRPEPAHGLSPNRHLLDGRLPWRRPRLECGSTPALLGKIPMRHEFLHLKRWKSFVPVFAGLLAITAAAENTNSFPKSVDGKILFDRDVRPIFDQSCF